MFSGKKIFPYLSWGLFISLGIYQSGTISNANIKLSKKDKIEYYRSFILGTGVRYLYFLILTLISAILSCLLYVETDLTFFACPLFIYYFYNKLYYKHVVDIIYSKFRRTITDIVSGAIYNIIQFLCKTVLTEECSVRKEDIADFYERFGSKKLSQFGQSFSPHAGFDISIPIGGMQDFVDGCKAELAARQPGVRTIWWPSALGDDGGVPKL